MRACAAVCWPGGRVDGREGGHCGVWAWCRTTLLKGQLPDWDLWAPGGVNCIASVRQIGMGKSWLCNFSTGNITSRVRGSLAGLYDVGLMTQPSTCPPVLAGTTTGWTCSPRGGGS